METCRNVLSCLQLWRRDPGSVILEKPRRRDNDIHELMVHGGGKNTFNRYSG